MPEPSENSFQSQRARDLERLVELAGNRDPLGKLFAEVSEGVLQGDDVFRIRYIAVETGLIEYLHATNPDHPDFLTPDQAAEERAVDEARIKAAEVINQLSGSVSESELESLSKTKVGALVDLRIAFAKRRRLARSES